MRITLPFLSERKTYRSFAPSLWNEILREVIEFSAPSPCYLEAVGEDRQCFLFFREKQIYGAGKIEDGQFSDITIREFMLETEAMSSPQLRCLQVNSKILHSLLILFQKKPTLKLLTSLVDLDEVLDKIENELKSCIVCATQDQFLAALRYEKGRVTALCHEQSASAPQERNFREDFLVKVYTLSAEKPFTITIYEDLLVRYAQDAKTIADSFRGDITELYMTKPPMIILEFKGKEIDQWVMDRPTIHIGRTADNDIQIDNLAVSRLHAIIEKDMGDYFVRDCDSLNGTLLNNRKVGRSKLRHGDEIVIGKHTLVFLTQPGRPRPAAPDIAPFDQTMIITGKKAPAAAPQTAETHPRPPVLIARLETGQQAIELDKDRITFGKGDSADVSVNGFMVAERHAEIAREDDAFVLRHLSGRRRVSVGGKRIKECVLKDNDAIRIGKREFVFRK